MSPTSRAAFEMQVNNNSITKEKTALNRSLFPANDFFGTGRDNQFHDGPALERVDTGYTPD